MGIFGRKKASGALITRASAVSGSAVTALQFMNGVALSDEFTEEDLFKVWSVIYAASIRCIQDEADKEFLKDFLRGQITSPKLLSAFSKAADDPQEVLYINLEGAGADYASAISKDLAIHISDPALKTANTITKVQISDLAVIIFEHHLNEHFPELQRIHQLLVGVLAGSYAVNIEDICRGVRLYGSEGTNLRFLVAQTIFALAPILYVTRSLNE